METLNKITVGDARALAREKARIIDLSRWDLSGIDAIREVASAYAERAVARGLPEEYRNVYSAHFADALGGRVY